MARGMAREFKGALLTGGWPWYASMILSMSGANTSYVSSSPAYTPMPLSRLSTPDFTMRCEPQPRTPITTASLSRVIEHSREQSRAQ
jgi:hypothetical protein